MKGIDQIQYPSITSQIDFIFILIIFIILSFLILLTRIKKKKIKW